MKELNNQQVIIVSAIESFWHNNQKGPTFMELAEHMGVAKSTIHRHVQPLISAGVVEMEDGKHRSLRVRERSYTVWEFTFNNNVKAVVACEDEKRARRIAIASVSGRSFITETRESRRTLGEIMSQPGSEIAVVALKGIEE